MASAIPPVLIRVHLHAEGAIGMPNGGHTHVWTILRPHDARFPRENGSRGLVSPTKEELGAAHVHQTELLVREV